MARNTKTGISTKTSKVPTNLGACARNGHILLTAFTDIPFGDTVVVDRAFG